MSKKVLIVFLALTLVPAFAYAASFGEDTGGPSCGIASWFTSNTAKALAALLSLILITISFCRKMKWRYSISLVLLTILTLAGAELIEGTDIINSNNKPCIWMYANGRPLKNAEPLTNFIPSKAPHE